MPSDDLRFETERLVMRTPHDDMAGALVEYGRRNKGHFAASGPLVTTEATEEQTLRSLRDGQAELASGAGVRWYLFERNKPSGEIIGNITFSNIVRGVFLAAHLGYRIDHRFEGRGLMTEGLLRAIAWAFDESKLHRLMANYVPTNERSGKVLRRLGFVVEGYARDYLYLEGRWKDHVLTSLVKAP